MSGRLYVVIREISIPLSDIWIDEESFNDVGSEGIKECIQEDLLSFIDDIQLLDHCKFEWK